jgi:hypothetical protein
MMTQLVLEGSGTNGCLHERNELVFYLTHPFLSVRLISSYLSCTFICVCTSHNVAIYLTHPFMSIRLIM